MPPFSFKSPAFLAGSSAVGTGGVGVAGWQIWEEVNITTDKKLMRQGFKRGVVPKSTLVTNIQHESISSTGSTRFQFRPYGCFNSFFPLENEISGYSQYAEQGSKIPDPFKVNEVKSNIESDQSPIGCALMHLSYTKTPHEKFIFKSEVTVKNDRFGGVLGTGVSYDSSKNENSGQQKGLLNYYVLFLKKQTSDKGKIEGGYVGFDFHGKGDANGITISSPDNENGINSQGSYPKEKKYSGIWETTKDSGKEIFEEIHVHSSNADEEEILGKKVNGGEEFKFEGNLHHGYKSAPAGYNTTSNKGQEFEGITGVDISKTLDILYDPFKGKKGSGTKVGNYCDRKYKEKYVNPKDLDAVTRLCYIKETTTL